MQSKDISTLTGGHKDCTLLYHSGVAVSAYKKKNLAHTLSLNLCIMHLFYHVFIRPLHQAKDHILNKIGVMQKLHFQSKTEDKRTTKQ